MLGRFPRWRAELEVLLDCQRLLQLPPTPADFPAVGEVLGGFRLLSELGRGAAGRGLTAFAGRPAGGPEGHAVRP
jgi:hypothetical protein